MRAPLKAYLRGKSEEIYGIKRQYVDSLAELRGDLDIIIGVNDGTIIRIIEGNVYRESKLPSEGTMAYKDNIPLTV